MRMREDREGEYKLKNLLTAMWEIFKTDKFWKMRFLSFILSLAFWKRKIISATNGIPHSPSEILLTDKTKWKAAITWSRAAGRHIPDAPEMNSSQ